MNNRLTTIHHWLLLLAALLMAPAQAASSEDTVSGLARIYIKQFDIVGSTQVSRRQLIAMAVPYQNRWITSEELEQLRQLLTRYYIQRGYVNSGVVIPEQRIVDGVLRLQVIEGHLADLQVTNEGRLRPEYVAERLADVTDPDVVFNIQDLQQRLKLIKDDPRIANIDATVRPGAQRSSAELLVDLEQALLQSINLRYDNYGSAALHGIRYGLDFNTLNLTGWGDTLSLGYSNTRGLNTLQLNYAWPLNWRNSKLLLDYMRSDASVVEPPFSLLDIVSARRSYAIGVQHPLIHQLGRNVTVGLKLKHQTASTTLLGQPYSFTSNLADKRTASSVIALTQSWIERSANAALALNSELRLGTSLLGATEHATGPDSQFHILWVQGEWFRQLPLGSLLLRGSAQLSDDELFTEQRFSIGGVSSVRGYREGAISADQGIQLSLEWRLRLADVLQDLAPDSQWHAWQLTPFMDMGYVHNKGATPLSVDTLHSVGLGLRWHYRDVLHMRLDYGHALETGPQQPSQTLQDDGVHFSLNLKLAY